MTGLRTFKTRCKFWFATFLIVPLPSIFSCVSVDLYTKLCCMDIIWFIWCPWIVTNPRAVIPNPNPAFIHMISSDSNPEIWGASFLWQDGDQIIILRLVLDDHHVCEIFLAPLSGLGPVHCLVWVVIRPAQSSLSQATTWKCSEQLLMW